MIYGSKRSVIRSFNAIIFPFLKDATNACLMALNLEIDGHLVMLILMIIFKFCDDWLRNIFIN